MTLSQLLLESEKYWKKWFKDNPIMKSVKTMEQKMEQWLSAFRVFNNTITDPYDKSSIILGNNIINILGNKKTSVWAFSFYEYLAFI